MSGSERDISDNQLRQAWAHLSTDHIRQMKADPSPGVMAARERIIRMREQEEQTK